MGTRDENWDSLRSLVPDDSSLTFSSPIFFFLLLLLFLYLHLQECNLWKGKKYTLYLPVSGTWAARSDFPGRHGRLKKEQHGWRLDLFFSMCSSPWPCPQLTCSLSAADLEVALAPRAGRQNFSGSEQPHPCWLGSSFSIPQDKSQIWLEENTKKTAAGGYL